MIKYDTEHAPRTLTVNPVLMAGLVAAQLSTAQIGNQQKGLDKSLFKHDRYYSSAILPSFDHYRSVITGEYHQGHDPLEGIISAKFNPLVEQLNSWVDSINLPNKWQAEGVHPPTLECRKLAKSVVLQLLKIYQLYPSRISATIEEGAFINYINHVNKHNLSIEVYNDLDIAAIITRDKEIIMSADITNENFKEIIQIFNARQLS